MKNIYTTVGVYGNGEYVVNGVDIKDVSDHVKYNINTRTGRALFIEGVCIYHGFLPPTEVLKWEQKIQSDPETFTAQETTKPYK